MPPCSSTRWCPTPEQRMVLKELYNRGLTNPKPSQIQNITAYLSFFGKIHGKNVFYWFQNHKARDRQKLRKKLASATKQHHHHRHSFPYNSHPQHYDGAEVEGMMKHALGTAAEDLRRDWLIRRCGWDSTTIPTFSACCGNRPLETLELFPLTSPAGQMDPQHITAADSDL